MAEASPLVKKRGKIRGLVTRLHTKIDKEGYLYKSRLDHDEIASVKAIIKSLESKLQSLQDCDRDIHDDAEEELDTCLIYETQINVTITKLENLVREPPPKPSTPVAVSSAHVKLSKLKLPSFSGDRLQWVSFWDTFNSAIHENKTLRDVENFS